ncbi:MAG: vWA domain-containing protein [Acidimicrobiales bacterium]
MTSTSAPCEADLADLTARFGRLLHAAGLPVVPSRAGRLAAAMVLAPPATDAELYWMARVTLVSDQAGIEIFDRVFAQVFGGLVDPAELRGPQPPVGAIARAPEPPGPSSPALARAGQPADPSLVAPSEAPAHSDGIEPGREVVMAAVSADERLRSKDFAHLTATELAQLQVLAAKMAFATPLRRSRRHTRRRSGPELDVRATLRRATRTGGEPLVEVRRRRRQRSRRLVLICDVSGSMEQYSRAYLQLLLSSVRTARAEAFVFSTRLTRLTRALRASTADVALQKAGRAAHDWSGGTRIGDALKSFNDSYGRPGLARGAVVVVLSDGWDCGDPSVVSREMARLHRLAYRVIWVNPRRAAPGFAPMVGGMAAALPHVDAFVSGHSLAGMDEVLDAMGPSSFEHPVAGRSGPLEPITVKQASGR